MKIVIVGGVAGGASAAARARRLDENATIILFERGEFISFANCGLPYHIGNVISDREDLLVMTPAKFHARTNIDVRVRHEVIAINRDSKSVTVRNHLTGEDFEESYDKLVLATGARPAMPPIPGANHERVMHLWTIPDMDRIRAHITPHARHAVVVGAGFVGLEVAENLQLRGLDVTLVEMLPQVLPPLDPEMAGPLQKSLEAEGIRVLLNRKVVSIQETAEIAPDQVRQDDGTVSSGRLRARLDDGTTIEADFIVMSAGIVPNSELAAAAGLETGTRNAIRVNACLQTSDPDIYAVGDVIESLNLVSKDAAYVPLAGPANRQGRLAADNICGRTRRYPGTMATAVVKVFELTAAHTGLNEKQLQKNGTPFQKLYIHPQSHASYYPGAQPMTLKLLFGDDGAIFGAQIVGYEGVDKRIDVIATAMAGGLGVEDLSELDLAYAPPYSSARDPVNYAGMIAANALRSDTTLLHWNNLPENIMLLDVREPSEFEQGHPDGAVLIPLGKLRQRLHELPRDRKIGVYCRVGLRGYLGERILKQNGFDAGNISGGWLSYRMFQQAGE
jgi:NADPH-dependent 2,4-dienoyl-CoA reductase/sulfur reductase-like enzyme/rhodanese-related sulfurtransferase